MAASRGVLSDEERLAAQAAIRQLYGELESEPKIAEMIGISQGAVSKARLHASVGPAVFRDIARFLKIQPHEMVERYREAVIAEAKPATDDDVKEQVWRTIAVLHAGVSAHAIRAIIDEMWASIPADVSRSDRVTAILAEVTKRLKPGAVAADRARKDEKAQQRKTRDWRRRLAEVAPEFREKKRVEREDAAKKKAEEVPAQEHDTDHDKPRARRRRSVA